MRKNKINSIITIDKPTKMRYNALQNFSKIKRRFYSPFFIIFWKHIFIVIIPNDINAAQPIKRDATVKYLRMLDIFIFIIFNAPTYGKTAIINNINENEKPLIKPFISNSHSFHYQNYLLCNLFCLC